MTDRNSTPFRSRVVGRLLTFALTIALICAMLPLSSTQADTVTPISKLSPALQRALTVSESLVWQNTGKQTVRALIQTNGAVSSALTKAIKTAGGSVVRQFTSINAVLAELPKSSLLTIAARTDV